MGLMMIEEKRTASPAPHERNREQVLFFTTSVRDGNAVQRQLHEAQTVMVGGGVIGSLTVGLLAEAGVGHLRVLDPMKIDTRMVEADPLLRSEDIGRPRAEALCERLRQHYPALSSESVDADPHSTEELTTVLRGATCAVACLDAPAPALLEALNAAALMVDTRWIVGQMYRGVGLVGPFIIPHQTPCYKCYELRRDANLNNYTETMHYESRLREMPGIRSECVAPRPLAALLSAFLALETQRLLTGVCTPQTIGRVARLDFFSPEVTYHRILRFPHCPACGYGKRRP